MIQKFLALGIGVALAGASLQVLAADSTAQHVPPARAQGTASRDTLVDLYLQLQTLQDQLRDLRGQVEVQTHEIERLKARQRDLLADLDRRVRDLERRGGASASAGATVPAASAATPPETGVGGGTSAETGTAGAAPVPMAGQQEQQAYDAAFGLMKQGLYERAAQSFRDFIKQYPNSALAGNAQYWVGEASYYVRNFRVALDEFTKVVRDYPASPKVPDAMLKIGYSHYELGEWQKAQDILNQVMKKYPNTTVAKSAETRLAMMK